MTRNFMGEQPVDDFDGWMTETLGADRDFFPVDFDRILHGDLTAPQPTILRRSDGAHLLYEGGKLHWVQSEPEAGKTWIALIATKELLERGERVVYFDYEMAPQDIARRLRALGLSDRDFAGLRYIRPPGKMSAETLEFYGADTAGSPALFRDAALVIFDACTEAMVTDGLDPMDNTDVAAWLQRAPRLAARLGASVLVLDHVPKDRENRGRYAIGAQHKLAQADASYALFSVKPFAPGAVGLSAIVVTKDRIGGLREHALDQRRVGTLVINAEDPDGRLEGFIAEAQPNEGPTERMEEILEFARSSVEPMSKAQLESIGRGRGRTSREAVARLVADGRLIPYPDDANKGRVHPRWVAAPEETS